MESSPPDPRDWDLTVSGHRQTAVARIYNWKDGINSRGTEHGTPYRQIREWHVGGDNEQVVELVRAVLSCLES